MVVLSPSLSLHTPYSSSLSSKTLLLQSELRNQSAITMHHNKNCGLNGASQIYSSAASEPTSRRPFWRRDSLLFGLSSSLLSLFPSSRSFAEEDLKMASLVDEINAYSYLYPLEFPSKKLFFKWVESRKAERYSSAAPLSPDARLRNVSEGVDIIDNLIISATIGPPNSRFLKSADKSTWTVKDVADSVLSDKAALINGEPYWYDEYLVRKSPAKTPSLSFLLLKNQTFPGIMFLRRVNEIKPHCIAGNLYTLNASTLNKQWSTMGPVLEKTVASFRLLPPTEEYVPPYRDPWRLW